jgi:cytochrome b
MGQIAANTEAGGNSPPATVRVWDPLVRIFHWSLVAGFFFALFSAEEWGSAHITAGYIVAGLIGVRIVWGLIGTRHARFSSFIYSPTQVAKFTKDSLQLKAKRHIGHNPAGGMMVIALLLAVIGISLTGYMMTTDQFWGIEWVEEAHSLLVWGTLALIGLHVAGVLLASFEHKENLIRSMFTGKKRR